MFDRLIEKLKTAPKKIVFTEGSDERILSATDRLKKEGFLTPILIGNPDEVKSAAAAGGFDIEGIEILDPAAYAGMDEMAEKMVALRKGKMTPEQCREALSHGNYFGTMLVKMGLADALLGGATYSRRYRPSRAPAGEDQARRAPRLFLLHSGARRGKDRHGRLRHQHFL